VATFEASLVIRRPLAATFAFVTDLRNAPSWDPRTYDAKQITPGHIGLGTRFVLRGGLISRTTLERLHVPDWLRQASELDYEVVSFVPRREMVVRGETAVLRYEDHMVFSAEGDATRLHYLATLELKGALEVGDLLIDPIFDVIGSEATRGIPGAVEAVVPAVAPVPRAASLALPANPIIGPDDVRRVVALDDDAVLRNLFITLGYHDLSRAIIALTGGADINWCTLGTWASRTAGTFIRDEEVPALFRKLLESDAAAPGSREVHQVLNLEAAPHPFNLIEIARAIVHDCAAYIAAGNKVVYAELAQCCADFVRTLGSDTSFDPARLAEFQARFTDGDPAPDEVEWGPGRTLSSRPRGGQVMLRGMVKQLYQAMFETDPKRRAEHMLLANALGGLHEQTRLQTYIVGGLDAPLADTLLAGAHRHADRSASGDRRGHLHTTIDALLPALARRLEDAWRTFATDLLMTLTLPDGVLHLGDPIPQDGDSPLLPPLLATIDDPELAAVLDRYGALHVRVGHSVSGWLRARIRSLFGGKTTAVEELADVGALDWTAFDQRMRYILTLFRLRQHDRDLFTPPFTDEQRAAIFEGRPLRRTDAALGSP
jgi:hypothetical protein